MAIHNRRTRRATRRCVVLAAGAILLLAAPGTALAQDGFFFSRPLGALTLRTGGLLYGAGGDLFGQLRRDLTLDRGDFAALTLGADLAFAAHRRADVVVGLSYAHARRGSEFRDWVDNDNLPIEQTTELHTLPVTATLRYHLLSRGREVSRVSWVPTSLNAYVGAGGGFARYKLQHYGDFIDFRDHSIYYGNLDSEGWDAIVHVLAGADYWFRTRVGLNAELRHSRGSAKPVNSFSTFDRVDLGSTQATVGLTFRW